ANGFDALIGTKASQADLNDAKKLINDNSLSINATKNALQVKADQTTVDRVKNQVDTVSAQQTIQANQIAQRVTQSTLTNKLNGYATQDYVSGAITNESNRINLNVASLETRTKESLSGAGVNLQVGTTKGATGSTESSSNGSARWTTNQYRISPEFDFEFEVGKTYTISFYLTCNDTPPENLYVDVNTYAVKGNSNIWSGSVWVSGAPTNDSGGKKVVKGVYHCEFTFVADKAYTRWSVYKKPGAITNTTVTLDSVKLELGSTSSPYTPNPADLATTKQITDLNVDLNGVKATVATQGQAISEFNQRATGLEGRVADNKNNIDSLKLTADGLRNQVGTLVPKSDLDNTNKRINDLSTLISQTKNSVDIKANRTDVDRLNQSVTEYNAKLSVQADQITNLVTKSELTTATNGLATETWVQNQVKQTADQWNL
ncbi:MAG: hypothetical protein MJ139_06335, partial [Limosilactobacillus sp.]|nr:hypothetical protein [Limosilactobacillus sp.]